MSKDIKYLFITIISLIFIFCSVWLVGINFAVIMLSLFICLNIIYFEKQKQKSIINPVTFIGLFWFLYTNADFINNIDNSSYLKNVSGYVYFLYTLIIVIFYIAYSTFSFSPGKKKYTFSSTHEWTIKIASSISLILISVQYYYLIFVFGGWDFIFLSKGERTLLISGVSIIYTASSQILYMLAPLMYILSKRNRLRSIKYLSYLMIFSNVTISLLIIDRSNLLISILPIIFLKDHFNKISNYLLGLLSIGAFIILIDFKNLVFNILNNSSVFSLNIKIPEEFFVSFSITKDIIEKLESNSIEYLYGMSYLETLLTTLIPFVQVDALSTWYVKTYYPSIYNSGGGLAFSSVAESVLNFGIVGILIYFILIGYVFKSVAIKKDNSDLFLLFYSLLIPMTYKLFRSEFYSLIKTPVWFWIMPLLLILLLNSLFNSVKMKGK
ncbi:O-antigen polymerase [Exiguobacterium aurantiacum]|uniref:O-antigen polymerase n=1 Tax=Exiguobacterium aurantiacum TaxID=33987 RepID=UPI003D020F2F